jgi:hypothetical protein
MPHGRRFREILGPSGQHVKSLRLVGLVVTKLGANKEGVYISHDRIPRDGGFLGIIQFEVHSDHVPDL